MLWDENQDNIYILKTIFFNYKKISLKAAFSYCLREENVRLRRAIIIAAVAATFYLVIDIAVIAATCEGIKTIKNADLDVTIYT